MLNYFKIFILFVFFTVTVETSYGIDEISDPYEKSNRRIHEFNDKIDIYFLRPVSISYSYLPNPLEKGIVNVLQNYGEPINITNYILQGEIGSAFSSMLRLIINSSFGLFGLFDIAEKINLYENNTDFDKTLTKWGVKEGNYLVVPFIGPRSSRHFAGSIIDIAINPLNYLLKDEDNTIRISPTILFAVSSRSGNMDTIDNLRETSIDYYSSLKSIYYQNRYESLGNSSDNLIIDDFFETLDEENTNE